jgi:hypothetical protein
VGSWRSSRRMVVVDGGGLALFTRRMSRNDVDRITKKGSKRPNNRSGERWCSAGGKRRSPKGGGFSSKRQIPPTRIELEARWTSLESILLHDTIRAAKEIRTSSPTKVLLFLDVRDLQGTSPAARFPRCTWACVSCEINKVGGQQFNCPWRENRRALSTPFRRPVLASGDQEDGRS